MEFNDYSIAEPKAWLPPKLFLVMKLTLVFLIMALMQVSAKSYSQQISLNEKNAPLEKVLQSIEKQTGYVFLYTNKGIKEAIVTVHVTNSSIDETLKACFENSAITFKMVDKNILLRLNESPLQDTSVQRVNIHGTVTDSKDQLPLRGATVQHVGGPQQTITDEKGAFTISVPKKSQLKFTMVGYKAVIMAASVNMKIALESDVKKLAEVQVTVGYGTQKSELLSGSIEHIKFTEADNEIPTTMAGNLLAGRMAGVSVGNPNGIPGQSSPGITIRTPTSFTGTAQPVLFVIDGKVSNITDFNNLSPNEIDEVTALKDAAATAAYGARAAGGVMLVTTKRGKVGKALVQYSFNTGVDTRLKNMPLTSAIQTGQITNQVNPGSTDAWTPADFAYMQNINNGYGYNQLQTIWRNPYTTTHNLSVSGGSEKLKYFIGGSYVKQEGFMKNLEYDKYNFRANISGDLTKNLSFFAGMALNNNLTYSTTSTGVGDPNGIYSKLLVWQPWQPVYTKGGLPIDYGWIANVGQETNGGGGYINSNLLKPTINLNMTYKVPFVPGLSATASYIKSYTDSRTKAFQKRYTMYVMKAPDQYMISTNDADVVGTKLSTQVNPSYLNEQSNWAEDKQLNLQLNYEKTFNKHHIKGWLVYESAESKSGGMDAESDSFPVYTTDQWWATSTQAINQYISNDPKYADVTTGRRSWVGQAFYDYSEKYLASFTSRYDGSMNFAPDKRWGFFPSGSVGWIISKEPFFENVKGIDLLKLTASAGLTGNDAVGSSYLWLDTYQNGKSAYFGTTPSTNAGVTYGPVPNQDFTWEKSFNRNYAVTVEFLKHFSSKVEYWQTHTYDILGSRIQSIPPTFSLSAPPQNYGKVDAEGIDVSFNYYTKIGQVNFNTGINASYGNAVTKLKDESITYPYDKSVGRSQSAISAYYTEVGMIRTQADLNNLLAKDPKYTFNGHAPALGQLIYKDISGPNGVPDGVIDSWDQSVIRANNNPINVGWNLSASWNGFSLAATFAGSFRQWKSFNDLSGGVQWNRLWANWATDSWTPNNPNATLPKRYGTNDGTKDVNNAGSNFWFANASFLRLRNLNVAYSIPASWCSKVGIQGVRLYASGSNLFIISGFNKKYYDPEMGGGTAFPIMRSFNFGCAVSL